MFQLNDNLEIKKYYIENSPIFVVDNFYKNPNKILNLFLKIPPKIHKKNSKKSYNMIFFEDKRHIFKCEELIEVNQFLGALCGQKTYYYENMGFTNFTLFKDPQFNDYKNNYWWPHLDGGYNGVLYLNKNDQVCGTNLYSIVDLQNEPPTNVEEHEQPWRRKEKYKLIHQIKPKYNRMVLFDGLKFTHGMNICNDHYFHDTYRINQIFFFEKNEQHKPIGPPHNMRKIKVIDY
jgi:hypothetical protein